MSSSETKLPLKICSRNCKVYCKCHPFSGSASDEKKKKKYFLKERKEMLPTALRNQVGVYYLSAEYNWLVA